MKSLVKGLQASGGSCERGDFGAQLFKEASDMNPVDKHVVDLDVIGQQALAVGFAELAPADPRNAVVTFQIQRMVDARERKPGQGRDENEVVPCLQFLNVEVLRRVRDRFAYRLVEGREIIDKIQRDQAEQIVAIADMREGRMQGIVEHDRLAVQPVTEVLDRVERPDRDEHERRIQRQRILLRELLESGNIDVGVDVVEGKVGPAKEFEVCSSLPGLEVNLFHFGH